MTANGQYVWRFACPACGADLVPSVPADTAMGAEAAASMGVDAAAEASIGEHAAAHQMHCAGCGRIYQRLGAIWDFLLPDDAAATLTFVREYSEIRGSENRSTSVEALRALPETIGSDPRRREWRIRRASWEGLARLLLPRLNRAEGGALRIVDAGAGNGWLSHRLALAGHVPLALDLRVDGDDGLGAASAFDAGGHGPLFARARATFQRMPVPTGEADAVVFNAALHYSPAVEDALREAVRALGDHGCVVILDSPFYLRPADGEKMLAERRAAFRARYGTDSSAHGGPEYFTWAGMGALASSLGLDWEEHRPWRGVRFAARPLVARLRRRRPPATFPIVVLWRGKAAPLI